MKSYVTCKELIGFLDDYVAGEVAAPRVELFERHLSRCPSCRAYLETYRTTITLARSAAPDATTLPPELLTAILSAVSRNTDP